MISFLINSEPVIHKINDVSLKQKFSYYFKLYFIYLIEFYPIVLILLAFPIIEYSLLIFDYFQSIVEYQLYIKI